MLSLTDSLRCVATAIVLAGLGTSCRETAKPLVPASVLVVSGDGQIAPAGQALLEPLVVRVVDSAGHGLPGMSVTWSVTAGGGRVGSGTTADSSGPLRTTTDGAGLASASWTLGTDGGPNGMTASATAVSPASFSASAYQLTHAIAPGYAHACALGFAGLVYCWGELLLVPPPQPATLVEGGLRFTFISAGENTCGITSDGSAYCWGYNDQGQNGNSTNSPSLTPTPVAGGLKFASLSAGSFTTCGVTVGGAAYCWGLNDQGQLGNGTTASSSTPAPVSGGLRFSSVSVGYRTNCGVTSGGAVYCWGGNYLGQFGVQWQTTPVPVLAGWTFASVTVGIYHACGLAANGRAYCWGDNSLGQLGTGSIGGSATPVPVSGNLTFTSLSTNRYHTCGTTAGGTAYCWGQNNEGEIGNGSASAAVLVPTPVLGGLAFASVSTGAESSCGLTTNGVAYCWGLNDAGQVGAGTDPHAVVPTLVSTPRGITAAPPAGSNVQRNR